MQMKWSTMAISKIADPSWYSGECTQAPFRSVQAYDLDLYAKLQTNRF